MQTVMCEISLEASISKVKFKFFFQRWGEQLDFLVPYVK